LVPGRVDLRFPDYRLPALLGFMITLAPHYTRKPLPAAKQKSRNPVTADFFGVVGRLGLNLTTLVYLHNHGERASG
jgi:hypothetical protein